MARRAPPFRRTCALALSASLLLSSWQAPALARAEDAAPPPMSTEQAMQALTNGGFFANDRDNRLRAMVTTPEGGLTPFGETVARMYSANQTIDREEVARVRESGRELPAGIENNLLMGDMMRQHRDQLQRIANSNADPRIIQLEMRAALRDMRRDFGDVANLRPGGNGENIDPIAGSVLVSAGFDGASRAQRQYNARELRVMENGNTLSVFAPNGELLFAEDKDKRKIFDQRVFEAQRTARASLRNASNPELLACANDVNATGVLDYSYLNFQRCQVMLSIQAARRERELQQVQAMAALLGEHPKPEDVDSPGKVTALLNRYKEMTVRTGTFIPSWVPLRSDLLGVNLESGMPTAWSMISDRFQRSGTHLEKAQTDYEEYERLVNSYRGASEITREQLQTLQDLEGRVRRSLTMAQLEGFNFKIDQYLELLSYSVKRDANGFPTDLIGSAPNPSSRELQETLAGLPPDRRADAEKRIREMSELLLQMLQVQFRLRKKIEGEPGDSDLRTSSTMLRGMQDGLVAIGRIQNGLGAVLPMRHNMMEHGRTLADLNDGTILGTLGNHVKAFFWDNISYTPTFTFAAANVVNFVSSRVWGGDWGGDYLRRREYMASRRPDLDNVMVSITSGNHNRAYVQMVLADPAAVDTHAARPIEAAAERLTMADRFDAVMRKARQIVAQVMETHQWTGIVADTIKWAGFMAVAAPVLSRVFLSRAIAAESAINAASSGTRNAFRLFRSEVYRGIGERLAALSPKMLERGAYYTLVKAPLTRFVRTTGMLLASEFLFGAIGGAQTVLVEHWIPKLQGKSSPFTSAWDALHRGAIGSAQWLTQSWHPLILFVNIPYTAYGGTRFGEFAQKFASNGLGSYTAGLLTPTTPSKTLAGLFAKITGSATTKAVWERRLAMETMLSPGTAWYVRMPLGLLVMADHLAKFHYFSEFMGYLGTHIGYWARTAPVSEETKQAVRARTEWMPGWMQSVVRWPFGLHVQDEGMRTRYALSDGQAWKEAPLWALLPMHPAQGRSAQQYRMGEKYFDWIARNGTAAEKIRIINMTALESQGAEKVVPTDRRARKHVGRQGWQEWLQEGRLDSRLMDEGFTPSEAQQAAILRRGDFLMSEITALKGKSANSLPAMLRILLETPDGKLVGEGGIKMGKVVREVLRERIIQEMEGKPDGVKDILLHKEKFHPGLGIQIDGATAMLLSRLVRLAEQDGSRKFAAVKELVDKNLANVDAKMDAVANAAIAMEKAFFALRHDPSEPFLDAMRETRKVMERLERAQEDKDPAKREHYLDAHEEIRKIQDDAIKSGKLRAEEAEALKHPTRYMDAIEELYNAENNAAGAGARIADGRNIIANEVEGRAAPGAAKEMVQAFHQAIGELTDAHMNGPVKAHPKGRVSSSRFNDAYENDLEYHPKPQKGKSNHPLIDKDGPSVMTKIDIMYEIINGDHLKTGKRISGLTAEEAGKIHPLARKIMELREKIPANQLLSKENLDALKRAVTTVRRAPWMLTNSQMRPLKGWRVGQYLSTFGYVMSLMEVYGQGKPAPKIFLMAPTGGGKTQILTIGVVPVSQAVAKRAGRQHYLVTNKRILVEQMVNEMQAMSLTGRVKVKTWSDIVGDQAQRKLISGDATRNIALDLDEGDAYPLNPQSTVGEEAGIISRMHEGRKRLLESNKAMRDMLEGRRADMDLELQDTFNRLQAQREEIENSLAANPTAKLAKLQERMRQEALNLGRTQDVPDWRDSKAALKKIDALEKRLAGGTYADTAAMRETIRALEKDLGEGKGGREVQEKLVDLSIRWRRVNERLSETKLRSMVAEHDALVDSLGLTDAYRVSRMKELGQRILARLDSLDAGLARAAPPVGIRERIASLFGRDQRARDLRERFAEERRLLENTPVDSSAHQREVSQLADRAEALGQKDVAKSLREQAQKLLRLGRDVWPEALDPVRTAVEKAIKIMETAGQKDWVSRARREVEELRVRQRLSENEADILALATGRDAGLAKRADELVAQLRRLADGAEKAGETSVAKALRTKVEALEKIEAPKDIRAEKIEPAREALEAASKLMEAADKKEWVAQARDALRTVDWNERVGELLRQRETLITKGTTEFDPIWEIMKSMKESTQGHRSLYLAAESAEKAQMEYLERGKRLLKSFPERMRSSAFALEQLHSALVAERAIVAEGKPLKGYEQRARLRLRDRGVRDDAMTTAMVNAEIRLLMAARMKELNVQIPRVKEMMESTRKAADMVESSVTGLATAMEELTAVPAPRRAWLGQAYSRLYRILDEGVEVQKKLQSSDSRERKAAEERKEELIKEKEAASKEVNLRNETVAVEILARLRKLASDPITATEPSARARAETLKKAAEILTAPETFSRGSEAVLELQTWRVMTEMMGQRQTALMRELGRELAAEGAAKKRGLPSDPARDARISSLQDRSDTVSAEIDGLVKDIARQETAYFGRLLLEVQATNRRAAATFVTFEQTASKELAYMRSIADASTSPQAAGRLREAVETMGLARGAMARLLGPELSKDLGPGVRKSQEAYARLHEAQTKEFTERLLKAYGSYYTMDSLARTKSILEIKNNTSTTILGFLPKIALLLLGAKPVPVQIVDGKAVSGSKYNDLRRALDVMSRADILAPARLPVKVLHFIANRIAPEAKATAFLRRWSVPEQRKVYVAEELSAMREYHHNPTSRFRFDGIFKRVESVHIGDIVPGLQQRDKGAEEISRGVDIQKRLKDKTLVSSKEMLLDDAAMPLVGTSGTRSSVAWPRMNESSWKTEGTGSTRPSRIGLEVDVNSSGSITRVIRAIRDGGENAMHLVFVPDNRGYKNVREAILRSGVRNSRQLAAVFSDMSHFAENFPRSNMEAQKNFKGPSSIESGDANVLIMHSAHSRGIDPPYSKKFNRFVVHLLDPHLMSESQVIQAIGRAAKGRRPVGATLEVVYYANATSSNAHPLFRGMMTYDPSVRSMFERLERNPPRRLLQRMASEGRSRIDAGDLVLELEAVESAGYSGPLNRLDVVAYRDAVRRMIETAGRMEEAQQLQGSGFFGDKPLDASSYRPLPWMPDGRAGE